MRSLLLLLVSLSAAAEEPPPPLTLAEANAAVVEIRGHRDAVVTLYDGYVKAHKPELAQCVSGPKDTLRALAEVGDRTLSTLQLVGEGSERAAVEGRKLRVAVTKSRELHQQAEACASTGDAIVEPLGPDPAEESSDIEVGNTDLGTDPPGVTPFE